MASRSAIDWLAGSPRRALLTLTLLVAAVFAPAWQFDFVRWDDPVNVTHNPLLTEPWSWDLGAKLLNGATALRFKPVAWLLYRGIYSAVGFHPAAWHAANLVLHLASTWLLWAVLRAVLARVRPGTPEAERNLWAWFGAALWAVHPARVEPASWVTATPYPLMMVFLLGSFLAYIRAIHETNAAPRRRVLALSWLLAIGAYASYPVCVTYAAWLAIAEVGIFRTAPASAAPWSAWARWSLRPGLFLLPAIASVLVTWQSSSTTPWLYPAPPTLAEVDLWLRAKMTLAAVAVVWTHELWPVGLSPNNPLLPDALAHGPMVLLHALGAGALLVAALTLRRKAPGFTVTVLGTTALALPVLGFAQWPTWAVADRHLYLPHLIPIGALAVVLAGARAARSIRFGAALVFVAAAALLSRRQVEIWRDTDHLFTYLEAQPAFTWNPIQQAYIYQLWGADAQEAGDAAKARDKFTQARRVLQDAMLGAAERRQWAEAIDLSQRLEQAFGLPPPLRRERVRWLLVSGRLDEAGRELVRVRRELPEDADAAALEHDWQERTRAAGNRL